MKVYVYDLERNEIMSEFEFKQNKSFLNKIIREFRVILKHYCDKLVEVKIGNNIIWGVEKCRE